MQKSEQLRIDAHLAEQEEQAKRWGVKIENEHLFNDHANAVRDIRGLFFFMGLTLILLLGIFALSEFIQEEKQIARDLIELKDSCVSFPNGQFVNEHIAVDCKKQTITLLWGDD